MGMIIHWKFFRVPKLRFLAGPASLLDEVSRGTQNWSVRAVTISTQSILVTFQTFRPFLVIWGHFRPSWPFWPQIQNCRRLVMWPLKMTAREAEIQWRWFQMSLFILSGLFLSFGAFFGHFFGQFWPPTQNCHNLVMWPLKMTARRAEIQ